MLKLYDGGAYLVNGTEIITDEAEVKAVRYPGRKPERRQWLTEF